ncbi:TIM-barrel domain-containing protein [Mucilaginibacter sp. R-33]|uniref:glycoside hydrolase family 31 protein n=1 Tax=Mucilaginibacter sp. R-33 TaxID=3416711 RepID=UPI003CEB533C
MKFKKITLILICVMGISRLMAQSPVLMPGNLSKVIVNGQEIVFEAGGVFGKVAVYSPSVIRVRLDKKPLGRDFSYAVVAQPQKVKTSITQNEESITVLTDSLKAVIHKKPFAIAYYTTDGQLINQDEPGLTTGWVGEEVTTYKTIMPGERFIGLGEKTGNLDRKGNAYTNWNSDTYGYQVDQDPIYSTIPFYIGIHHKLNYGVFMDNTYQSDFNFGASNNRFSSFGAHGGEMNYYFIYNQNIAGIIQSYTALTGHMKMPPLWSLGYQQNRYSYYPDTEVLRIAQTLREKKIPSDGITLDIHYMDRYQLFTWDKNRFPDPAELTSKLNKLGFKLTVIVDPGIKVEKGAPAYESGAKDSVFIQYPDKTFYTGQVWPGWCNFTDFTSEKGRAWWRKQVKFFADNGVSGIWNDMNEISTWGQKMPSNVLFDFDGAKTTHLQAHNVYALEMIRSSYEGAREHFKERPFILTRSGYAGLQRYSAIWTGDNRAEENHMLLGVRLMNSLGLSGVSFTAMDIGGFTGGASTSLFTRWMQIGAFIPYYRNHTALNTKASEPWAYGEDALEISRNYINFRYRLIPYMYSNFYESTQTGMPVMRSLAINYTFDPKVYDPAFQNQYMFGGAFMIAPFESTKEYGRIYFPEGTWYNLYNDEQIQGQQEAVEPLNMSHLPVFVKESSIIPMQSLVQTTSEAPTDTLTLHIYNGRLNNTFILYQDDGKSYNYENNDFNKRVINFDPTQRKLIISEPTGNFNSRFTRLKLVMHSFKNLDKIALNNKVLNGLKGAYTMIEPVDNIDPQGLVNGKKDAAPVVEINVKLSPQKQVFEYELKK